MPHEHKNHTKSEYSSKRYAHSYPTAGRYSKSLTHRYERRQASQQIAEQLASHDTAPFYAYLYSQDWLDEASERFLEDSAAAHDDGYLHPEDWEDYGYDGWHDGWHDDWYSAGEDDWYYGRSCTWEDNRDWDGDRNAETWHTPSYRHFREPDNPELMWQDYEEAKEYEQMYATEYDTYEDEPVPAPESWAARKEVDDAITDAFRDNLKRKHPRHA